jgi:hypothetical protein
MFNQAEQKVVVNDVLRKDGKRQWKNLNLKEYLISKP